MGMTDPHVLYLAREVTDLAGITYRQLDHWERCGAIWLEHPADGSGSRRQFTPTEMHDLVVVGRVVNKARAHGLRIGLNTIEQMWAALKKGEDWAFVGLSIHDGEVTDA